MYSCNTVSKVCIDTRVMVKRRNPLVDNSLTVHK